MLINSFQTQQKISFGQIHSNYKNNDVNTREAIRESLESKMDATYKYMDELGTLSRGEIEYRIHNYSSKAQGFNPNIKNSKSNRIHSYQSPTKNVDVDILKEQKIYGFNERVKNHIYSGERLSQKPEAVSALKEAGIKTVLCLLPREDEYRHLANKNGLKYIDLYSIGDNSLSVFNFDAVGSIVKNPEKYATNDDKEIEDLKAFTNVVNGKDENFPHPLYMGCQWGTDRTWEWYTISQVLKDQPQDQPLTPERIERLSELLHIIKDSKRW